MSKTLIFKLLTAMILVVVISASVWYAYNQLGTNSSPQLNLPTASPTTKPQETTTPPPSNNPANPSTPPTNNPGNPTSPTQSPTNPTLSPTQAPTSTPASPTPTPPPPTPTPTLPPPTPPPTPTPTPIQLPPIIASFDFDTGGPSLTSGATIPFNQTKDGVTAQFSSPTAAAFSIQSDATTFFKLSMLQGNYLYDNKPSRDILEIKFSQPLNSINFTFATIEPHGGPTDQPSNITLTAFLDSNFVGSAISRGTWPSIDTYPQGTLTYNSGNVQFNLVKIELPNQQTTAVDYLIDSISVQTA